MPLVTRLAYLGWAFSIYKYVSGGVGGRGKRDRMRENLKARENKPI